MGSRCPVPSNRIYRLIKPTRQLKFLDQLSHLSSILLFYWVQYGREQNIKLNIKQNIKQKYGECQMPQLSPEIKRWLIKILIDLTGRSASSIAETIGIHRSGLTEWLKGRTTLGPESQDKVLKVLGVLEGELDKNVVHIWNLKGGDLSPLVHTLAWASSNPYEMVYMAPNTLRVKDWLSPEWRSSLENPIQIGVVLPLAIYDLEKKVRILFRRKLGALAVNPQEIDILVDDGLSKWKTIPKDSFFSKTTIRVDPNIFDNCLSGNVSIEEYDWILGLEATISTKGAREETPRTWEELLKQAQAKGISLQEASEKLLGRGKDK